MVITSIISIVSFSGIILQDFKQYAIHWIWLILLFIAFVTEGLMEMPFMEFLKNSMLNLCFVTVLFGLLTLVFSILKQRLIWLTKEMIGWGDLLFFTTLAFGFSPVNFMAMFNILMVSVLLFVIICKIRKPEIRRIPLAGAMSLIMLVLLLVLKLFGYSFKTFDDTEILSILNYLYV